MTTTAGAATSIDERYLLEQARALVRINSINPAFSGGTTDERAVAAHVDGELRALGMQTQLLEPEARRTSVIGRLHGTGGGRSLMLYAHYDTVAIEGMTSDPFAAEVRDGRLYGRGAYDMKGALASCIAAVKTIAAAGALRGDVYIAAVADEEVASIGIQEVLRHVLTDGAIVTEPTELQLCLAHKGFSWIEVETFGRAAHGSRFQDGIDANMRMGRFLAALEVLEQRLRSATPHERLGPPSLHAAVLKGGTGTSTYAEHARLEIERRTLPGETEESVVAEIREITDKLAGSDPTFKSNVRAFLTRPSYEARSDSPIVHAARKAATDVLGHPPAEIGAAYWMDTALIAAAGIDTVCIGPTGAGAHAAEEWVDLHSMKQLAEILARAAREYCA